MKKKNEMKNVKVKTDVVKKLKIDAAKQGMFLSGFIENMIEYNRDNKLDFKDWMLKKEQKQDYIIRLRNKVLKSLVEIKSFGDTGLYFDNILDTDFDVNDFDDVARILDFNEKVWTSEMYDEGEWIIKIGF